MIVIYSIYLVCICVPPFNMVSWLLLPGCFCLVHRTWRCSRRASPPTTPSSSWRRMVTTRRSWWELEAWDGFILVLSTLYFGASMWLVYPHLLQQLHFDWLYMCGCWWYVSVMRIQNARPLLSRSLVANNDTAITNSEWKYRGNRKLYWENRKILLILVPP